jgi:hypothetical protein
MSTESEKYRMAAKAALALAEKAKDNASKASWLRHFEEWTRLAEEAEKAEQAGMSKPLKCSNLLSTLSLRP